MNKLMELKEKVKALLAEIDKTHRYSMSHIYGIYNEVFGVAEIPQACASCLIRKKNQLKNWLQSQPDEDTTAHPDKGEKNTTTPKRKYKRTQKK